MNIVIRVLREAPLALASLSALISAAARADTIHAEPAGNWQVYYEDWDCALRRDLLIGGKPGYFSLAIEPTNPIAAVRIGIQGRGNPSYGDAIIFLDGKHVPKAIGYTAFDEDGYRVREFGLDIIRHSLDTLRGGIRLSTNRDGDVETKLDDFQSAWAALNKCMVDLYRDLGITKSDLSQIAKAPEGGTFWYVDTPRAPYVEIALFCWINSEGRAENCRLLKPSGFQDFDSVVCKQIERKARFTPAKNAAGERIRIPHYEHDYLRPMVIHAPG